MSMTQAPRPGQVQTTDDDRRRRHALLDLARELEWLEANTAPVPGEAAAVAESWRNVDLALETLGLPPAIARERMPRPGGES